MKRVLFLIFAIFSFDAVSGVKPLHTREVIGIDREYKVDVVNTSGEKYLVQAWLEDLKGNVRDIPAVLTPPIFEISEYGSGIIRIMPITNSLPNDRESVFWLNIQEVPRKTKNVTGNQLKIAIRTRIKVFLRPKQFSMKGLQEASANLKWSRIKKDDGKQYVVAENDSPYYLSLGRLLVINNGKSEPLSEHHNMVPPFGKQSYPLPSTFKGESFTIKHGIINDFGGVNVVHENTLK